MSSFNILKTLFSTYWVFWCFHNPPNYGMDHRTFNMHVQSFVCGGLLFIVSSEGLLESLHRIWLPQKYWSGHKDWHIMVNMVTMLSSAWFIFWELVLLLSSTDSLISITTYYYAQYFLWVFCQNEYFLWLFCQNDVVIFALVLLASFNVCLMHTHAFADQCEHETQSSD